jgi:hypothetical protein
VNPHKNMEAEEKALSEAMVTRLEDQLAKYLTTTEMKLKAEAWKKAQKSQNRKKAPESDSDQVEGEIGVAAGNDDNDVLTTPITLVVEGLDEDDDAASEMRETVEEGETVQAVPVATVATLKNCLGPEVVLGEEITPNTWLPVRFTVAAIRKMRVQLTSYGMSVAFFNLYQRAYEASKKEPDSIDNTPLANPNDLGSMGQMLAGMLCLPPVCTIRAERVIKMEAAKVDLEADVWLTVREHVGVVLLSGLQDIEVDPCGLPCLPGDKVRDTNWSSKLLL